MKKLFTIVCAALLSAGMWADTAIISWQLGANGAELTKEDEANFITGAAGSAAEGWTITITGNASKKWAGGNGKIFLNGDSIRTIKNSNGALNTVTLPTGLYASKVEFYAVTNDDATKGTLKEFDGGACKDTVHSLKDYNNPTYIVKELEEAKNAFTFTFGGKQVCLIAVVTYSAQTPEAPKPYALLSWHLGVDGAELTKADEANSLTGAAGSEAEGWTIAMTGNTEKNWAAGGKMVVKGKELKSLKNSNGVEITVTLPEGLYATHVEFHAVTNDTELKGTLKNFNGEDCQDSVYSLKDYASPTIIRKDLEFPSNDFTFLFGGKQVCFIAVVEYTDDPDGEDAVENVREDLKAVKVVENGQVLIIKNGVRYNALGVKQ